MSVLRYVVPALAVAGSAVAQCGSGGTLTIQNSGDASALASCETYDGNIAVATQAAGTISISGLRRISGNLIAKDAEDLSSLGADSLEEIGGRFELEGLTILSTLSFPQLKTVNSIMWTALPALQGLSFTAGVEELNQLEIINTDLASLDGINLQVADVVTITNNRFLESINMQLGNITEQLTLADNSNRLVVEFPNLEWAYNMTFRNCSSVSLPSLASLNGSMGFYSNGFESLSAPNLTSVGGTLSFVSNEALTNISMPELTTVSGGVQVANNTALETIDGFPQLATVGGALDFNGAFNEVDLPALDDVRGAFNLQSTGDLDEACDHFSSIAGPTDVIKGEYTCQGGLGDDEVGGAGSLPDGTNSGGGSSSSSNAAHPILIPGATGVLGVIAAIFGML